MLARILPGARSRSDDRLQPDKRTAAKVSDELTERGFAAAALARDLRQGTREQALRAPSAIIKVDVLVATDVAARGIDVENVTHVITNFQCPRGQKTISPDRAHRAAGNTRVAR